MPNNQYTKLENGTMLKWIKNPERNNRNTLKKVRNGAYSVVFGVVFGNARVDYAVIGKKTKIINDIQ